MKKIYAFLLLAGLFLLGAQNVKATISVVGDFNSWTGGVNEMTETSVGSGIYTASTFLTGDQYGDVYFKIYNSEGDAWFGAGKIYNNDSELELVGTGDANSNIKLHLPWANTDVKFYWDATNERIYVAVNSIPASTPATVVGTTNLTGVNWDLNEESNDMTLNNGVWSWSNSRVYLDANAEFKVAFNRAYTLSYPKSNKVISISEAGYYDIAISFDYGTREVSVEKTFLYPKVVIQGGTAIGTFELENLHTEPVYLGGTKWLYASANLTAGKYTSGEGFKMSINNGTANGIFNVLTRLNTTFIELNDPANTCGLNADIDGEYEFRYYLNGDNVGKVMIIYPMDFTREITPEQVGKYQTLCVPFWCTVSHAEVYEFDAVNGNTITLTSHIGNLSAGKSYIIKPTGGDITVHSPGGGKSDGPVNPENKATGLYGNLYEPYTYKYNTESVKAEPWVNIFVLQDDNMFHQVQAGGEVTINSTRAYLHIDGAEITSAPALRIIEANNGATNIENVETNEQAVKFIENGQLFIKKNGVIYNAVGAAVK